MHVISAAQEKRVVDGDQPAAIPHERAQLVDQPVRAVLEIHPPAGGLGEEGGIQEDAIKLCAIAAHGAHGREEIAAEEIVAADGKMIERVRPAGNIEELPTAIELDHALRSARQRGGAQAAGVGEGIQHLPAGGMGFEPGAQVAGIEIEAGVLVEGEIQRVAHPVLDDQIRRVRAAQDHPAPVARCSGMARLKQDAVQPGQGIQKNIFHWRQGDRRAGLVGDHRRVAVEIDGHVLAGFVEAVEQPNTTLVCWIDMILALFNGCG